MTAKSKTALTTSMNADLPSKGTWNYYRFLAKLKSFLADLMDSIVNNVDVPVIKSRVVSLAHDSAASVSIGDALPAGSSVVGYAARIDTTFDGTAPTVTIGIEGDEDQIMVDSVLDLTGAADSGVASLIVPVKYTTAAQLLLTYVADSSAAGAAEIIVFYI